MIRIVALLVVSATCGCDGDAAGRASAATWHAAQRLILGVMDGDSIQEFGRVVHAVKMADGRIAVADNGNSEVRVFHPDGRHSLTVGRRGEGPGEFYALTRLALGAGDTLIAGATSRIARYAPSGVYIDELILPWTGVAQPPWFVEGAWPIGNGDFLLKLLRGTEGPDTPDLSRPPEMYVVASRAGEVRDTLGEFQGLEQLSYQAGGEHHTAIPVFAPHTLRAASGEVVVIGDMASDSVLRYNTASREVSWIHVPLESRPLSRAELEAARDRQCSQANSMERCQETFRRLPDESRLPVFSDLAVDSIGHVWLRVSVATEAASSEWLVLDEAGRVSSRVALPSGLRVLQIGGSYILGMSQDSLGIQRIEEFELRR